MGKQIVRQPDGKFAIWSSVVDDFTVVDYENAQEIIDDFVAEARRDIERKVKAIVEALERGDKPYYQFTKSFDECVELIRANHGDDADSLKLLGVSQDNGVRANVGR